MLIYGKLTFRQNRRISLGRCRSRNRGRKDVRFPQHYNRLTTCLECSFFENGKLIHAQYGNVSGDDAATSILSWINGAFSFDVNRRWTNDHTVSQSFEQIGAQPYTCSGRRSLPRLGIPSQAPRKSNWSKGFVNPDVELGPNEWAFLTENW